MLFRGLDPQGVDPFNNKVNSKTMISCFLCCDITNMLIDEHISVLVEVI